MLKPLSDYVVLRQLEAEEQTKSGIYIPDSAKEKPTKGEVIAVGPGTKDITMELSAGDVVLYKKYAGDTVKLDGEEFIVLRQDGVIAKLA
ncbi:co-chaperone GroES [Candidatus Gracilibacteria bacterium CG17_big_fil_post_rev_8_21_14_2_50_48_13]|nr:MAG: co-chaperone GroES [Candidatus Gracilibacteria bacterium CG17_big_fil_post_rev_8_21_14_2_50_48_13]